MTPTTYSTACPKCGAQLAPVALDPQTAPWLCAGCHRGYWAPELSTRAREAFRHGHDDWGIARPEWLRLAVTAERDEAEARGTSLREDQFVHAPRELLAATSKRVRGPFAEAIAAHLAQSEGVTA